MTQKTFKFTRQLLMVLSVVLSIALIIFLELNAWPGKVRRQASRQILAGLSPGVSVFQAMLWVEPGNRHAAECAVPGARFSVILPLLFPADNTCKRWITRKLPLVKSSGNIPGHPWCRAAHARQLRIMKRKKLWLCRSRSVRHSGGNYSGCWLSTRWSGSSSAWFFISLPLKINGKN